jgi:hypothetical protein
MSNGEPKLDRTRPYGRVRTHRSQARFAQDGMYFDHYGKYLCLQAGVPVEKPEEPPVEGPGGKLNVPEAKGKGKPKSSSGDALARASAKLGINVGAVPSAVADAARENARALAAEENA